MRPEKLYEIFNHLLKFNKKIKAEVLLSELQNNSDITAEDYVISNKSTFTRAYGGDVITAHLNGDKDNLTVDLARNGLYDSLPEGLFHKQAISKDTKSYIDRRKIVKEEELASRSFFSPIENEFFLQRLQIEQNERNLLNGFGHLKNDFLFDFWEIHTDMPKKYAVSLITLLPFCHKIVGDLELTQLSLEKILGEKVQIERTSELLVNKEKDNEIAISLGHDTILESNEYGIRVPALEFTIGPILTENIDRYLNEYKLYEFLDVFYDYFVPMEMEVKTKLVVDKEGEFLLGETNKSILGFSSGL
jgi:hypothetical protein